VRVALVCPYSWTVPGGVQAHVDGLASALRRLGHEADVLAPADGPVEGVVPLGRSVPIPSNGSIQRVALMPASIVRTVRAVRGGRYDVVHLHEPMLPAVCLTAIAAARAPLVGTFHMFRTELLWYRVFAPVVRAAAARLSARIAVSAAACRYVSRALPGDYEVIPNGIDHARLAAIEAARRGGRVLFVGRPEPRKGLSVLLDAFARLGGDAELALVGPRGDYGPHVHALGRVSGEALLAELARADVLCAPSLGGESFGIVVAEGMAAGLPVVASRIEGYVDVLDEESGRLVEPGDPEALAAALRGLLADGDLRRRLGEHGREASARFGWDRIAERILAVYDRVTRGSGARSGRSEPPGGFS
jgi:phosphatidylinositol alpha-mannosyltransferase